MLGQVRFPVKSRQQLEEERIREEMARGAAPGLMQQEPVINPPVQIPEQLQTQRMPSQAITPQVTQQELQQVPGQKMQLNPEESMMSNEITAEFQRNKDSKDELTNLIDIVHKFSNYLATPSGLRVASMFLPPETAVLVNRRAALIEQAAAGDQARKQDIAVKLFASGMQGKDIARISGLEEFRDIEAKPGKEKADLLRKYELGLKKEGATRITEQEASKYPRSAIRDLGEGYIFKVKPKALGAEAAAKIATSKEGRRGFEEIQDQLKNKKISYLDIQQAATKGLKRVGTTAQKLAARLELVSEGLGRALSGAAVPEHEIKAFRRLFAINPLDTPKTIDYKLDRSIRIIKDLENYMSYGGTYDDVNVRSYVDRSRREGVPTEGMSPEDQQAINWARANPDDPRSARILELAGGI